MSAATCGGWTGPDIASLIRAYEAPQRFFFFFFP